jgi:hypothetical protein
MPWEALPAGILIGPDDLLYAATYCIAMSLTARTPNSIFKQRGRGQEDAA